MRPLVWLLWDAASAVLAERFLAEGALPNLARLAEHGTRAAARPAWPCAQTPPGMATLITGAPASVHGVYGYREAARPRALHSALETETGFDARRLRAEPFWTTAARAGRTVTLAFAPLAAPHDAYERGGVWAPGTGPSILTFDGYGAVLAGQAVHRSSELEKTPEGLRLVLPLAEKPPSLLFKPGPASVRVEGPEGVAELRERRPAALFLGPTVGVTLVLLALGKDEFTVWRSGIWNVRSSDPEAAEELCQRAGPFLGSGAGHAHREGSLPAPDADYLATLAAEARFFARASAFAVELGADVTVVYEPCIDETGHLFQDLYEQGSERGLALVRESYRLADEHLGAVLERVPEDAIVAIGSDHGQQGVRRLFRPNVVLREAGLLATDDAGRIDLDRTKVLYGPAANGFLLVNAEGSLRGIVPRAEVAEVARRAVEVLLAHEDAGGPLLLGAHLAGEVTPSGSVPGSDAGDVCLVAAPGVALGTGAVGAAVEPGTGGQHTTALDVPELDALFLVAGPGVPRLGRLPSRIDNADVAPTLARLIGIPRPAHATGRALWDAKI
jgi:hypothetical protein